MRDAGMATWIDAAGNTVGRYEGAEPGLPALLTGSHQDTVRAGGRYDGMLGIIAPISCIKALHRQDRRLPYAVEVIAFGDEEGVRFQTTLLGSRAVAGTFDPSVLDRTDPDGITMRQAMRDFGLDPEGIGKIARRPDQVLGFVELHIEQGPVLEAKNLPVGTVTAIAGCVRLAVRFEGEAGHAGTVPMDRRQDALAAAAEAVLAVERLAKAAPGLVATVGRIEASPGAINVIPGAVAFSVDARAPDDKDRLALARRIEDELRAIAQRRGVRVAIDRTLDAKAAACAPRLMDRMDAAIRAEGIEPFRLFSGAGHDAMAMGALTEIAMLFVRCERGISHNPAEMITAADAGIAARVLLRFMEGFGKGN
jgi:allantoate deiminase